MRWLAVARVAGEPSLRRLRQRLLALIRQSERELGLAELQQRFASSADPSPELRRAASARRRSARAPRRSRPARAVASPSRWSDRVPDSPSRCATRAAGSGWSSRYLLTASLCSSCKTPKMRHHRDHRFGIVAGPRHQLQAVAVGLQLVARARSSPSCRLRRGRRTRR